MSLKGLSLGLFLCAALLSEVSVRAETTEDNSAATTPATIATVYVQVKNGVNVYNAASTGKLSLVKGSPFSVSGQMEGVNGRYLLSVGTTNLHTYTISSNGAIGKQQATTNTQNYSGSECGNTSGQGSVLDHSGRYLYLQLNSLNQCADWQTYQIGSMGELSFIGDVEYYSVEDGDARSSSVPTISSNDLYGYGAFPAEAVNTSFSAFKRGANGAFEENHSFSEIGPKANPKCCGWKYYPSLIQADPSGHLAVLMYPANAESEAGPYQMASYTINPSTGAIKSTNTYQNMPVPYSYDYVSLSMSPTGKLVALAGTGLQIFHFNGASPVTTFSGWLNSNVRFEQVKWDNNNHLYALSYSTQKLYVYTVTPTSITPVAGSPYTVPAPYGVKGLVVVPK